MCHQVRESGIAGRLVRDPCVSGAPLNEAPRIRRGVLLSAPGARERDDDADGTSPREPPCAVSRVGDAHPSEIGVLGWAIVVWRWEDPFT